jgi:hypothetical protein
LSLLTGGRSNATTSATLATAVVVIVAGVLGVLRVHSGSAERQQWTATVVAADLAIATMVVALLTAVGAAARRPRVAARTTASVMEADSAGTAGGRWPRLEYVPVETLGVREPRTAGGRRREQVPYVPRAELDPRLREALGVHRFVLVHGPAGVRHRPGHPPGPGRPGVHRHRPRSTVGR